MRPISRLISLIIATAAGAFLATAAIAADVLVEDSEFAGYDWTGFYVGVQGGWQNHEVDVEDPVEGFSDEYDFDGGVFGAHAGYDIQTEHFVFGIVGDLEWAGGDGESDGFGFGDVFAKAEANWQGSVRGRLGYAFDRALIYGTVGLAFANYDFDYTCCGLGFDIGDEFDETVLGVTAGGGAAFAVSPALAIWADYRFTSYEEASSDIINCCAPPPNSQDHDVDTHAVRVGVSYYFGSM